MKLPSLSRGLLEASRVVGLALLTELSGLGAVLDTQRADLVVPRRRQLEPAPRVHLPVQLDLGNRRPRASPRQPWPPLDQLHRQEVGPASGAAAVVVDQ